MGRILIIVDEAQIRFLIHKILEAADHTVVEAADGVEGLHIIQTASAPFQLIVLDMLMPKMDGLQFLDQLKQYTLNIPVLILTASRNLCMKAEEYGVGGCLLKPFNRKQLVDLVNRLIYPGTTPVLGVAASHETSYTHSGST
jgi:CheY-like chemotaxis protein